jgi:hypothetical protein
MTNETSGDDIKVGYKRPPRHSRFQPGRSGNQRGKQKGVRNLGSDVKRTLEVPVRLNEQGKERRVEDQSILDAYAEEVRSRPPSGAIPVRLGVAEDSGANLDG